MLLKYHIYATHANYFMYTYDITISVYVPDMNSMQSIMWRALVYIYFTLMTHAYEQTCLPHCTYMSHCISTVPIYRPNITAHICQKWINYNKFLPYYSKIISATNMPLQCHKYGMTKLFTMRVWEKYANIPATYEFSPINDVARITVHRW